MPRFAQTPRDVAIVRAVHVYHALTAAHIAALFFTPAPHRSGDARSVSSRCRNRLKLLFHAGYLLRGEQSQTLSEGRKPLVYFLDAKGAELIAHLDGCGVADLDWHPRENKVGWLFLDHLLATNDVRIALALATRTEGCTIERWLDDKTLKRAHAGELVTLTGPNGKTQRVAVVPDGYFVLGTPAATYHCFLEVDRATTTGESSVWGRRAYGLKVAAYLAYYRSGMYQARYQTKSIRILTVTTGEQRLANLKAITEHAGGKSRFWFTTFERIRTAQDVLTDPIWEVATREERHALI